MQSSSSTDNPAARRGWPALVVSMLGLCQVVVGLVIARSGGGSLLSGINSMWGYAGLVLLLGGIVGWAVVGLMIRCPFCDQRISRKAYPRPGYFCPKCGKTVAD